MQTSASSVALSSKSQTKLKAFLKEKEKPAKRFKSLVSFIEGAPKDELKPFFLDKYEQIFAVLLARFADLETSQKKDKKQHTAHVQTVISTFKQFIVVLASQIRSKFQYANLGRVVDSCLNVHNKHVVRRDGLELLLTFMEILGDQMEEQVSKFATAINIEPFLRPEEDKGETKISEKEREREDKKKRSDPSFATSPEMTCLAPAMQNATRADAVDLTKFYFEFISQPERIGKFEFWFELWKQNYFTLFFPKLSLELKLIDRIEVKRFEESCPPEIIGTLVERIAMWSEDIAINPIIWNNANGPLLMEISRQSCWLPVVNHAIIKQSMDVFKNILMAVSPAKIKVTDEYRQQYWKKFIDNLSLMFFISSKTIEQFERHASLIKDLLQIYSAFALDLGHFMFSDTWIFLQQSLLEMAHGLLSSTSPFALDSVAPTHNVADTIIQTLLIIWIRSEVTTPEMWKDLNAKLSSLTTWKATLTQWEDKLLQLTYLLIDLIYPKPVPPTEKKKKGNMAEEAEEKEKEKEEEEKTNLGSSSSEHHTSRRPADTRLTSMAWNEKNIQVMWNTILHLLGNPCDIKDPPNFSTAISCITQIIDLLCEAEERMTDKTAQPPVPILKLFLPWTIEATTVDEKRNRGRITAYSTLCKLLTRKTYKPYSIELASHFYRALQTGLAAHNSVVWVIIRNCTQLFSLPLPGVATLIPDFLREIEKLWRPNQKNTLPDDILCKSLQILLSLLSYPSHFDGLALPTMSATEMHAQLGTLFVAAINCPSVAPATKAMAVWGLGVYLYLDLQSKPPKERFTEQLRALVSSCSAPQDIISHTALESLSSLINTSDMLERIAAVEPSLVSYVVEVLSDDIIIAISAVKATHERLKGNEHGTALHFYLLLDGLMSIGHSTILELPANVVLKVFRALEFGLLGDEIQMGSPLAAIASHSSRESMKMPPTSFTSGSSGTRKTDKIKPGQENIQQELKSLSLDAIFESLKNQPAHGSELVRESAEVFLLTMLNFYANFPTLAGCEQIISRESLEEILGPSSSAIIKKTEHEEEDDGGLYFVYNSLSLFSFEEFVDDNERVVRMTIRDCTGKYVWDFDIHYDLFKSKKAAPPATIKANLLPPQTAEVAIVSNLEFPVDQVPSYELCKGHTVDPLDVLLNFLAANADDIIQPSPRTGEASKRFSARIKFNAPIDPNPAFKTDLEAMEVALRKQDEQVKTYVKPVSSLSALPQLDIVSRPATATKFHHTRILLSHIGLLSDENRMKFCFLENNKRMQRSLKELDKVNAREVAKIGLIFVKEGQIHQSSILMNENKSKDYADFVKSLGWTVNLQTHRGFLGGLDRWAGSTGTTAPYWSSAMVEVIFHDVTRMPTKESDPQQVHKKRHVGNDAVHIVWSENKYDYDPKTIISQFNDVHIVIYPMPNGLYRIQIFKKQADLLFGPLQDGMVVNKTILAPLARMTAINANRAVRSLKKENKRPFPFRAGLIREMYERYRSDRSFDEYFAPFFQVDDHPQSLVEATARREKEIQARMASERAEHS